ncbi:MAG: L-arabinose isomerase family protein [Armatimonadota bacterium]
MSNPRIGLLPLYLELYDNVISEARPGMEAFASTIVSAFQEKGLDVTVAPVCRLKPEFDSAVKMLEDAKVDAIVTLHLAYSPSLECAQALSETKLPIIVLDTTPTYAFGPGQDPAEIMGNHGIHGVQDMCNLLIRKGKPFQIEAGHWSESDVLDRVASWAQSAQLASMIRNARVGLIGDPFKGMGDFAVDPDVLKKTIGVETVPVDFPTLASLIPSQDDPAVKAEISSDLSSFDADDLDSEAHLNTVCAGLAVRKWLEKENLTGFTMNFGSFDRSAGMPTVPFLEASKSMARGLGYAGEGDVLTASLVGALASVYPETTFTEMFCPDWENDTIFLSHMGELNTNLAEGKARLMFKSLPFIDTGSPVMAVGRLQEGDAVLVNLAPGPDDTYSLILAPVEMIGSDGEDRMQETVRGWFKPYMPITDFLAQCSYAGGTHHSALVYGDVLDNLARFGVIMGWKVIILDEEQYSIH